MASKPSFIQRFAVGEEGYIDLYTYRPISGLIAQNYVRTQLPEDEYLSNGAGFWILEGYISDISLPESEYPSINDYLQRRVDKEMPRRFELYLAIDEAEAGILIDAFNATRRHVLETMAELPLEEKKIES
jgi:hypothetical protein